MSVILVGGSAPVSFIGMTNCEYMMCAASIAITRTISSTFSNAWGEQMRQVGCRRYSKTNSAAILLCCKK